MSPRRFLLFLAWTAAFLALFLWMERPEERAPSDELATLELREPDALDDAQQSAASAPREIERAERASATVDEAFGPPLPAEIPPGTYGPPAPLASISGRCVDAQTTPLRGVALQLSAVPERGRAWQDLQQESDGDGRFRFELETHKLSKLQLAARGSSGERQVFAWSFLPGGRAIDLGDVRLGGGATLRFRVIDSAGEPLAARWTIEVRSNGFGLEHRAEIRRVDYTQERPFAEGVIAGLPPGDAHVSLRHATLRFPTQANATLIEGASAEVELTCAARGLDQRLAVQLRFPYAPPSLRTREEKLWLETRSGERRMLERDDRFGGDYAVDGLAMEPHVLRVEHPSYPPFEQAEVFPGSTIAVELLGSAVLLLDVRDEASGLSVPSYGLALRYARPEGVGTQFVRRHELAELPPPDGRFDGIVPGRITALVSSPIHSTLELELGEIAPHETRRLNATLTAGATVHGTVHGHDERPAAICRVICGPRLADEVDARRFLRETSRDSAGQSWREDTTDELGRFEIAHLPPGPHWIVALGREGLNAEAALELAPSEKRSIAIVLPGAARLRGRLVPVTELPSDVLVRVTEVPRSADPRPALQDPPTARLGEEQRFEFFPLAVGAHRVELLLPGGTWNGHSLDHGPGGRISIELGRIELGAGETAERSFALALVLARCEIVLAIAGLEHLRGSVALRPLEGADAASAIGADIEEDGRARFPLAPPGTYEITVFAHGLHHPYVHPTPVKLVASRVESERIEIKATRGRIRLVDARTKQPLVASGVSLGESRVVREWRASDPRGELELFLAPGRYVVRAHDPREASLPPRRATLAWGEDGPLVAELEFER
jgi:hypothetical protein